MEQIESANSLEWHDGVFKGMQIDCSNEIIVKIFLDLHRADEGRKGMVVEFFNVSDLTSSIDGVEILDNRSAGNVSNGYVKKIGRSNRYKFYLYLSDGFVNLTFNNLKISDSNSNFPNP